MTEMRADWGKEITRKKNKKRKKRKKEKECKFHQGRHGNQGRDAYNEGCGEQKRRQWEISGTRPEV